MIRIKIYNDKMYKRGVRLEQKVEAERAPPILYSAGEYTVFSLKSFDYPRQLGDSTSCKMGLKASTHLRAQIDFCFIPVSLCV